MALENCKECNANVSDSAEVCPKCGVPAPTIIYTKNFPKCVIDGCYNESDRLMTKFRGMCRDHYQADLNKSVSMWWIIIFVVVIGLGLMF